MNPYLIGGPAQISFSGGRSSAMMLCEIVRAHQGTLPSDVIVQFANTGKEREETLLFVERVSRHLGVKTHWIEYRDVDGPQKDRWTEVDFYTASRNGEPFASMVTKRGYLPNPMARICTQHLKVNPMDASMRRFGIDEYCSVAGIRADEPQRVARMRAREDVDFVLPLADAGVTALDVMRFWQRMPFDLGLRSDNGATTEGNCDLCYLKGLPKIISLIRERPESADWWIEQETRSGKTFRNDRPNYAAMKIIATQPQLFDSFPDDNTLPCECTD